MTTETPSAFPVNSANLGGPGAYSADPGMTLRDWFAGQALAGMLADSNVVAGPKRVGVVAYEYADAMLAARKESEA